MTSSIETPLIQSSTGYDGIENNIPTTIASSEPGFSYAPTIASALVQNRWTGNYDNYFGNPSTWTYDTFSPPRIDPTMIEEAFQLYKNTTSGHHMSREQFETAMMSVYNQYYETYKENYNSINSQTSRQISAGYNPNFFSNPGSDQATSTNPASAYNPNLDLENRMNRLSTIGNVIGSIIPGITGNIFKSMGEVASIKKTNAEANLIEASTPGKVQGINLSNEGKRISNQYYTDVNPTKIKQYGVNLGMSQKELDKLDEYLVNRNKFGSETALSARLKNSSAIFDLFGFNKPDFFSGYDSINLDSNKGLDYVSKQLQNQLIDTQILMNKQNKLNLENVNKLVNAQIVAQNISNDAQSALTQYLKTSKIPADISKNLNDRRTQDLLYKQAPKLVRSQVTFEEMRAVLQGAQAMKALGDYNQGQILGKYYGHGNVNNILSGLGGNPTTDNDINQYMSNYMYNLFR